MMNSGMHTGGERGNGLGIKGVKIKKSKGCNQMIFPML